MSGAVLVHPAAAHSPQQVRALEAQTGLTAFFTADGRAAVLRRSQRAVGRTAKHPQPGPGDILPPGGPALDENL